MARSKSDKPKAPKTAKSKGAKAPKTIPAEIAGNSIALPDDTGNNRTAEPHPKARETSFKPGQSGNPNGRPKGARSRIAEFYLTQLEADFRVNGVAAIIKMREEKPVEYVKAVAACVPKAFDFDDEDDDGRKIIGVALITRDAIQAIIERGREDDDDGTA